MYLYLTGLPFSTSTDCIREWREGILNSLKQSIFHHLLGCFEKIPGILKTITLQKVNPTFFNFVIPTDLKPPKNLPLAATANASYHFIAFHYASTSNKCSIAACSRLKNLKRLSLLFADTVWFLSKI